MSTSNLHNNKGYQVKIETITWNKFNNIPLTTWILKYPRMVHSELMTHRMLSKNSSSSRAIPIKVMIRNVLCDPVVPVWFGKNQQGMQALEELTGFRYRLAKFIWLKFRYIAVACVWLLNKIGLHKQIANRILEPWMWIEVICSGTEWDNFFKLRAHPDAQPEIRKLAYMMLEKYDIALNQPKVYNSWHIPFVPDAEEITNVIRNYPELESELHKVRAFMKSSEFEVITYWSLVKLLIATGRIARVSYLTYEGKHDPKKDFELGTKLYTSGHWSPFEHCAKAVESTSYIANFSGFKQFRKYFSLESGIN